MRGLMLLIVLFGVMIPGQAQTDFECETGNRYDNTIGITVPDARVDFDNLPDDPDFVPGYFVTVVGLDETFPILRQSGIEFPFCQPSPSAFYEANLPSAGAFITDEQAAQIYSVDPGTLEFAFANEIADTGNYVFVLEGGSITPEDGAGDMFNLSFDLDIIAAIDIYVIALNEGYNPAISVLAADDSVLLNADTGDALLTDEYYLSLPTTGEPVSFNEQSAYLSVPDAALLNDTLRLRVDANDGTGDYLLAIHVRQQNPENVLPVAQLEMTDTGGILQCDDALYEESIVLDITAASLETPLQLTAIGQDGAVPVIAVLNDDNSGVCYMADADEERFDYALSLPDVEIIPPVAVAQTMLTEPARIAISVDNFTNSRFALLLEGLALTEDVPQQRHMLQVPSRTQITQPIVTAFMIATDSVLDPYLQLLDDDDTLLELDGVGFGCDNAGFDENCPPGTEDMDDSILQLGQVTLQALNIDTMLMFPYSENGQFVLESRASEDAGIGTYLLALYFVIP
ncbi:MAG: hypothetical protein ACPG7F_08600 [Aggregatilineales bacterium]